LTRRDVSLVKDVRFEIKFPAGYVNAGNFFTTNEVRLVMMHVAGRYTV
jgi:hypothetical protein